MPESKTPMGDSFDISGSPFQRRGNDGVSTAGEHAQSEALLDVPQMRGDEGVRAGEQVIRDEERHPILDMRAASTNVAVVEAWGDFRRPGGGY